ncbi:MAG: DUF4214 domain-containing protein [Myxococcales bacterium]|nr:DUF4214 domain-containing protein [Myxococcales bacterium]
MAKFVTTREFNALQASADIVTTFLQNFAGEASANDVVGYDGVTYANYFIVRGVADGEPAELALGGSFSFSGQPTGTIDYVSITEGGEPFYYLSDLQANPGATVPLFLGPSQPGELHPALAALLSGDDEITLSSGVDYFDAGTGSDKVVYDGTRADFSVTQGSEGQLTVTADADAGNVDTLVNVEKLTFEDGSLVFDLDSENASFAYRIYAAAYGRTPDEDGLRFWTGVLDERGDGPPEVADKEFVASFFLTANEFTDVYGENPTNEEYINKLYQNVLHREADQDGYDFWLGKIEEGEGRDDMLIYFTDSGENLQNTAPDLDNGIWVL